MTNSQWYTRLNQHSQYLLALHNSWSPIIAALFAGNGIVLKCSEKVVWSTGWFVGAITECLRACGHDPELVQASLIGSSERIPCNIMQQLVCCYPEEAEALTKSPEIKHITFIGSDTVGKKVGECTRLAHSYCQFLDLGRYCCCGEPHPSNIGTWR